MNGGNVGGDEWEREGMANTMQEEKIEKRKWCMKMEEKEYAWRKNRGRELREK